MAKSRRSAAATKAMVQHDILNHVMVLGAAFLGIVAVLIVVPNLISTQHAAVCTPCATTTTTASSTTSTVPPHAVITLNPSTGTPGKEISVAGTGFAASSSISITFGGVSVSGITNAPPNNLIFQNSGSSTTSTIAPVTTSTAPPTTTLVTTATTISTVSTTITSAATFLLEMSPTNCVTPATGYYQSGTVLQITADQVCEGGLPFMSWNGLGAGNYTGTSRTAQIVIDGNIYETAEYEGETTTPSTSTTSTIRPTTSSVSTSSSTISTTIISSSQCTSSASGTFTCEFAVPKQNPGVYTVTASDGHGHSASASFTIVASSTTTTATTTTLVTTTVPITVCNDKTRPCPT